MFTILICGDRYWVDPAMIKEKLEEAIRESELKPEDVILVHGDCYGADRLGAWAAKYIGVKDIRAYPANWEKEGPSAGPKRNLRMLNENAVDLVLAFHDSIATSKGTKHMVGIARKKGIKSVVYKHKEEG